MKRGMRILAFVLVFMVAYTFLNEVMLSKDGDGVRNFTRYYELPKDTIEVLLVGSSHMGTNINAKQLWQDYGISAYNLWANMQPTWNSYYYLKEALQYQNPEVVVLEVYRCGSTRDTEDFSWALQNILGMKSGINKIGAAMVSFDTWQKAAEALWGMPIYHSRYNELKKTDFEYNEYATSIDLNAVNVNNVLTSELPPYPVKLLEKQEIQEYIPLSEKAEKYLRKSIELCQAKNIDIVLMAAPYEAAYEEYARIGSVKYIADEYGIPFLNYLETAREIGIDPEKDFFDGGHLNANGIPKLTRILAEYLLNHFELKDYRYVEGHIWNQDDGESTDSNLLWEMEHQFQGDGLSRYIDTGVKLLENPYGNWTLLTQVDLQKRNGDNIYLSCFNEQQELGYYGLLLRGGMENKLDLKLGENETIHIPYSGNMIDIAIVKNAESYTVYVDGQVIQKDRPFPCESFSGNLLIGCQELSANGEKFRYSMTKVMDLEIFDRVLSEAEIKGWQPEKLPEMSLPLGMDGQVKDIYVLPEQFVGDSGSFVQNAYIDTGLKLYEESAASFTILSRITPSVVDGDKVFFSAFSEVPGEYRGLLVRQLEDQLLNVIVGNNHGITLPCVPGQMMDLAIVKTLNQYTVYVDGKLVQQIDSACAPYAGTLLIGAQRDGDGNIFRQSSTCVNSFTVKSGVMDESEIQTWNFTDAPMPQVRVATSVNYALTSRFLGNGQDRYIDTGVQLYDIPQKDWTMAVTLNFEYGKNSGVYLSCFSEEVGNYRGFMIRQEAEDSITILVGNALSYKIQLSEMDRTVRLVVAKRGNQYAIYRNGSLETSLESSCDSYEGTLLIGCQETAEGEKFRFSTAKVDELTMTDGALTDEQAAELSTVQEGVSRF